MCVSCVPWALPWELLRQRVVVSGDRPRFAHGLTVWGDQTVGAPIDLGQPQVVLPQKTFDAIQAPVFATTRPLYRYFVSGLMRCLCDRLEAVPKLPEKRSMLFYLFPSTREPFVHMLPRGATRARDGSPYQSVGFSSFAQGHFVTTFRRGIHRLRDSHTTAVRISSGSNNRVFFSAVFENASLHTSHMKSFPVVGGVGHNPVSPTDAAHGCASDISAQGGGRPGWVIFANFHLSGPPNRFAACLRSALEFCVHHRHGRRDCRSRPSCRPGLRARSGQSKASLFFCLLFLPHSSGKASVRVGHSPPAFRPYARRPPRSLSPLDIPIPELFICRGIRDRECIVIQNGRFGHGRCVRIPPCDGG